MAAVSHRRIGLEEAAVEELGETRKSPEGMTLWIVGGTELTGTSNGVDTAAQLVDEPALDGTENPFDEGAKSGAGRWAAHVSGTQIAEGDEEIRRLELNALVGYQGIRKPLVTPDAVMDGAHHRIDARGVEAQGQFFLAGS